MSLLDQLHLESGFAVCPGIKEYPSELRFETKNLRIWGNPFRRINSQQCLLWHISLIILDRLLPAHFTIAAKLVSNCIMTFNSYSSERQLLLQQRRLGKCVSSNYPLKYLSRHQPAKMKGLFELIVNVYSWRISCRNLLPLIVYWVINRAVRC